MILLTDCTIPCTHVFHIKGTVQHLGSMLICLPHTGMDGIIFLAV